MIISTIIWVASILILWCLTSITWFERPISWIKKHSKILISVAILIYTTTSIYTLFSNRSFFWTIFSALDRAVQLSFIYISFCSLAACAIYLTGRVKSNDSKTNDELPTSFVVCNAIYIIPLCLLGLFTLFTIIYPIIFFALAAALLANLDAQSRGDTSLTGISVIICLIVSFMVLSYSILFSSFLGSVLYSFAILLLFLFATKTIKFFHFAWSGSLIWLVGLAIFMLINSTAPLELITDQMRLSSDSRFSYRIEIVDRGRNSEHVRLFASEVETGKESTIILPELSGYLVTRDGEKFGDLVLWENDKYVLFLDQHMWSNGTNWLAINEIDMLAESATPFSLLDDREIFWLLNILWHEAQDLGGFSYLPCFAEVIQAKELIEQLTGRFCIWDFSWYISDLHRNESGLSLVEYVERQYTPQAPQALLTGQMRLSSDSRFSYRIEIISRGISPEHVRLFAREVETGDEISIILPEFPNSIVIENEEESVGLLLWEDDRYILFLDQRMRASNINVHAINEIDMSTESAVPFSRSNLRHFWLALDLWSNARLLGGVCNFPSFAEVIQAAELVEQLSGHFDRVDFYRLLTDYLHRNDFDLCLVEDVESQLAEATN